jgi:hypothetical protein
MKNGWNKERSKNLDPLDTALCPVWEGVGNDFLSSFIKGLLSDTSKGFMGAKLMRLPQQEGLAMDAPGDIILLNAPDPAQAMHDGNPLTSSLRQAGKLPITRLTGRSCHDRILTEESVGL